jgi:hypothetical protein
MILNELDVGMIAESGQTDFSFEDTNLAMKNPN